LARKKFGTGKRKTKKQKEKKESKILPYAHAPSYNIVHFCTKSSGNLPFWLKKKAFSAKLRPS